MTTTTMMAGKICVVTGGTAGIGLVTARELARRGADVTLVGRDPHRGELAVAAMRAVADGSAVDFIAADLSEQEQIRAFVGTFCDRRPRLDLLVNNAGGLFGSRRTTADGIERTLALNHLGYFLTTLLLLPWLQAAGSSRIVVVASEAHRDARLDFDDLQGEHRYNRWTAYRRSKLANLLFTYELARRLAGRGITANALHPGFVATDISATASSRSCCGGSARWRRSARRRGRAPACTWLARRSWRMSAAPISSRVQPPVHPPRPTRGRPPNGCGTSA